MDFVRIDLATSESVGEPGPLPSNLLGLDDETLADLPAALDPVPTVFEGFGYWPVDYEPAPDLDPRLQRVDGYKIALDSADKRATATPIVRDLTAEEIAALPPISLGSISDRQFFQALASDPYSMITQQEALDAVKTGEIPPIMQAVVDALPAEQQFPVTMILSGGIEYQRDNQLVEIFGASQGMTPAQIDDFWRFAQGL